MNESALKVGIRHMEKRDVPALVECEQKSHEFEDPDFGVPALPVFAFSEADIVEHVGQYKNEKVGVNDTRSWVCEVDKKVVGGFIYELQPDGYEFVFLTVHPDAPPEVRTEILAFIAEKAYKSATRKTVAMYVPDGDYKTLKSFMDNGYAHKLEPNPNGNDSWRVHKTFGGDRKGGKGGMPLVAV